ncbi:MAG: hypothetical protein H0T51_23570 [Pirellulales bacterium]|nr:hypothetical protein [Pirellulales bacterium]
MKLHRLGTIISLLLLPQTAAQAQPRYAYINIADSTGEFFSIANWRGPAINDSGTVAFFSTLDDGGWGVFTGDGGPVTTIADERVVFPFEQQPSINDAGDVAFQGGFYRALPVPVGDITSIVVGNATRLTTIVEKGDQYSFLGKPSISDNGSVAFSAGFKTGLRGLFISKDGAISTIADNLSFGSEPFAGLPPSINAWGDVAFRGGGHLRDQWRSTG